MKQSKLESLLESIANIIIGCGVALLSQVVVFPFYGIHVPIETNLAIMAWFTLISVGRSYVLRRFFNAGLNRVCARIARASF